MLLSSPERNDYTQRGKKNKNTYSKLWFLLYIYYVTLYLRHEGREEGGRCRPSQFHGLAGREKQLKKQTWILKKTTKKKQTERAAIITTTLLLFNFVSCLSFVPPLIWWKSRIFFIFDL